MSVPPRHVLVTGLVSLRDVVLALPRLAGLRAAEPNSHVTVRVPKAAVDLLQRLTLADRCWRLEDHHPLVWLWRQWRGRFDRVIDGVREAGEKDLWATVPFKKLQDDLAFLAPPSPFIVLAPPAQLPAVRMAALARRLMVEGYGVALLEGTTDAAWRQAFLKVVPECRDLSGRVGLPEVPSLTRLSFCWLGGGDAATLLAAQAGARTIIMTQGADSQAMQIATPSTTWLQADDLSLLSVGDMRKAITT